MPTKPSEMNVIEVIEYLSHLIASYKEVSPDSKEEAEAIEFSIGVVERAQELLKEE